MKTLILCLIVIIFSLPVDGFMYRGQDRRNTKWADNRNNQLYVRSWNEADSGTTFADVSPDGKTVTRNDNTHHENPFGADSAIAFDGTGDYLSLADSDDWDFGNGEFTIDFWVNFASAPSTIPADGLLSTQAAGGMDTGYRIDTYNGTFQLYVKPEGVGGYRLDTGVPIAEDTWYHVAVVRSVNTLTVYVNGEDKAHRTLTEMDTIDSANGLVIGRLFATTDNYYFNGHMDEIRVSKSIVRWTTDFDHALPNLPY